MSGRDITLVAAMGRNRVIGADGGMPWHLPADLQHFKQLTLGHTVIMGRRTFHSVGRPLPGRLNIVLSRGRPALPEGVLVAGDLDTALERSGDGPVMVIGGGEIYRLAMPRATAMVLTFVDAAPDGDTRFPAWNPSAWRLASTRVRPVDERNAFRLTFNHYRRVTA